MRPPELDVTLSIHDLACSVANDTSTDEPYMWILGFKVDAETITPALPGASSILPTLGVKVFTGVPAFPNLGTIRGGQSKAIPAALGTRSFRLTPALVPIAGWFPGIAGVVCLLWDQDNFDPGTAEAGHRKFNELFGPALSTELTRLINGDYDDPLSRDSSGSVASAPPPDMLPVVWRLSRLRDPAGRKNAVKAITAAVKDAIINRIKAAIKDEAGWDELLDPDDLLGVEAQVYLGDELSNPRDFSLHFTDDDADYTAKGHASASRVHLARLDSVLTKVVPTADRDIGLWLQVCWFGKKLYWATAYRLATTTTYTLSPILGGAPVSVRWFIDGKPLADGTSSVPVAFESVDIYEGPPQDALAPFYPGGPGTLTCKASGTTLEVSNAGGNGVYYGTVTAVFAYAGDPTLFPPLPIRPFSELKDQGYSAEAELGVIAVNLEMNDDYREDVRRCKRIEGEIDRKHIERYVARPVNPGDPPPFRQALLDRVAVAARLANAVGLNAVEQPVASQPLGGRRASPGKSIQGVPPMP